MSSKIKIGVQLGTADEGGWKEGKTNSVGGWSVLGLIKVLDGCKPVKYVTFTVNLYNRVGDIVFTKRLTITGPYYSTDAPSEGLWTNIVYDIPDASTAVVSSVTLTYMTGETENNVEATICPIYRNSTLVEHYDGRVWWENSTSFEYKPMETKKIKDDRPLWKKMLF